MFDSLDEQIKHDDEAEASTKERLMRYAIIGAVSIGAVVAIFAAVQFAH
jgi:uncharacterized membrane protein